VFAEYVGYAAAVAAAVPCCTEKNPTILEDLSSQMRSLGRLLEAD